MITVKLTKPELVQIRSLLDSECVQSNANITQKEVEILNAKLLGALDSDNDIKIQENKYAIINNNRIVVNGEQIDIPNNFDYEKTEIGYSIVKISERIDNLISWIPNANNAFDSQAMKNDLEFLLSLDDEYIFSSYSTNEYIISSDGDEFIELLEEVKTTIQKRKEV